MPFSVKCAGPRKNQEPSSNWTGLVFRDRFATVRSDRRFKKYFFLLQRRELSCKQRPERRNVKGVTRTSPHILLPFSLLQYMQIIFDAVRVFLFFCSNVHVSLCRSIISSNALETLSEKYRRAYVVRDHFDVVVEAFTN